MPEAERTQDVFARAARMAVENDGDVLARLDVKRGPLIVVTRASRVEAVLAPGAAWEQIARVEHLANLVEADLVGGEM